MQNFDHSGTLKRHEYSLIKTPTNFTQRVQNFEKMAREFQNDIYKFQSDLTN